jgi:hypothetical protein
MATSRGTRIRPMNVVVAPGSPAEATYRRRREAHAAAIEPGFPPLAQLDMHNFEGKSMQDMSYVNHFVGELTAWDAADIQRIEAALAGAMTDTNLNNMLAQYFNGVPPTATAMDRRQLTQTLPKDVYKDTIEGLVHDLHAGGSLSGVDLTKTVLNFMLPPGSILHSGDSTGAEDADDEGEFDHEEEDSTRGLGGYHGSIHPSANEAVYYAVGVYSQRNADGSENGIAVFDESWKNVVATFYHELQEARTDPDVGDVHTTADEGLLGWYSLYPKFGGEIGDIPINETAGLDMPITTVFKEVSLTDGSGTVPIQLMYSNVDHGPAEGSSTPMQALAGAPSVQPPGTK